MYLEGVIVELDPRSVHVQDVHILTWRGVLDVYEASDRIWREGNLGRGGRSRGASGQNDTKRHKGKS